MISTVTTKGEAYMAVHRMIQGDVLVVSPRDSIEPGPPVVIYRDERGYCIALFGEQPDMMTFRQPREVLELLREADFAE